MLKLTRRCLGRLAMAALLTTGLGPTLPRTANAQIKKASEVRIVFITHGQANDSYWTVVKNGMQEAAKVTGAKVDYFAPETFDVVRMARMIDAAVASKPDGIVVSIPDETALKEPIMAAKAAGIPVVVIDSGLEQVKPWGLDLFVGGGSEYDNGVRAGELMGQAGVKAGLCINHEVGNVSLDQRCEGYAVGLKKTNGSVAVVAVTLDPTEATRRVDAFMTAHPDVNGILTLGPTIATPILKMLQEHGALGKVKMGTFDLSPEALDAISQGSMMFGIDNQQYLMGYLPVVFLTNRAMYRLFPTDPVWTGPSFITKDSAAAVQKLSEAGFPLTDIRWAG